MELPVVSETHSPSVKSESLQIKNLREIIKNGPKGDVLLDIKTLNETSRSQLVENIINYYLDYKISLDKENFIKIANDIIVLFPKESLVLKTILFHCVIFKFNNF